MTTLEQRYTTGEVAASFGVAPGTVRYWVTTGLRVRGKPGRVKLAASGGVGRRRYTEADVNAFRRAIAPAD